MSQYTTGEIAKLCGVTVRTVQYYDNRAILTPSALTEGGRRLYTDDDVRKLRIICFLRDLGISISVISQLFQEENQNSVIELLLEQQEKTLREEISQRQDQLKRLTELRQGLKQMGRCTVESIGDVANNMENKKKLNRMYATMVAMGLPVSILQWVSIILWIVKGIWWLFLVWLVLAVPTGILMSRYYFNRVKYICPECHGVFRPAFKEAFFAKHTVRTRKLTCVCCGHKGFCVETWAGKNK